MQHTSYVHQIPYQSQLLLFQEALKRNLSENASISGGSYKLVNNKYILFLTGTFQRSIAEDWVRLGDIHVVHYEKVLRKRVDVLNWVLNFLGLEIDQKRMSCVEFLEDDMYKRKAGNKSFSPLEFTDVMRTEIVENTLYIDALLQMYGHDRIPLAIRSI